MIALAYAIPLGVFAGWSGVLDLILTPMHVSQVSILFLYVLCLTCSYSSFKAWVKHYSIPLLQKQGPYEINNIDFLPGFC